jgi:hypothetical protein
MVPSDGHARFWIAYVANFVREIGIRLNTTRDRRVECELPTKIWSASVSTRLKNVQRWMSDKGLLKSRRQHPTSRYSKPKTLISRCVTAETGQVFPTKNARRMFFALLVQPPISPATSCPTKHRAACNGKDAAIKRPKTRAMDPPQRVEERPRIKFQGTKRGASLGFSRVSGESPQKIGMVGCETSRGKIRLTMSALSFPQFTQIHSRIFFTFIRKPEHKGRRLKFEQGRTG